MIIALGTTRPPKVQAVQRVLEIVRARCPDFVIAPWRLEPRNVASGAPSTPTTTEETMTGARRRAEKALFHVRKEGWLVDLAIGLEGGLMTTGGHPFLESWAYVTDGMRGFFGSSGSIPLPARLAEAVLSRGRELGPEADHFFDTRDVAGREGTFGVLTNRLVSREEAFVRSLLHALAPFYNAGAYSKKPRES